MIWRCQILWDGIQKTVQNTHRPRISHAVRGVVVHEPLVHRTSEKTWGESWDKSCTMIIWSIRRSKSKHWNIIEPKISYIICIHDEYMNLRPSIFCTQTSSTWRLVGTHPRSTGQQNESQRFLPREIPPKSIKILIYPDIPWMIFRFVAGHFPYFPWRWLLQNSP